MRKKKRKIDQLQQRAEEAQALLQENLEQRNRLGEELRQVRAELHDPHTPAARRAELREQVKVIDQTFSRLYDDSKDLGARAMQAQTEFNAARQRLEGAHHVLETIASPPPWGLNYTPAQIRRFSRRARRTIAELAGR